MHLWPLREAGTYTCEAMTLHRLFFVLVYKVERMNVRTHRLNSDVCFSSSSTIVDFNGNGQLLCLWI